MRISVLGNSDTTGRHLPPGDIPWPRLVQERLGIELGEPVALDSWRFAPYRPGAADYALHLVAEAEPDFVVIPLASYWCAFTTVQRSVERRFGGRAAGLYASAEAAYRRRFESSATRAGPRRCLIRTVARKTFGAAPLLTVAQFVEVYSTVLRKLSRHEDLHVIVFGDRAFSAALREAMPTIEPAMVAIESRVKSLVLERRFDWADLDQAIRAGGRREPLLLEDGIHMTPGAHEQTAAMLMPLFLRYASASQVQ